MGENKYKRLFKDILVFGLGSIGSKLILFLMVPLYTNCLNTEEYGVTELVYTFMQLIVPFVSLVIYDAVVRFGLSKQKNKEDVLKTGFVVLLFGSVVTIFLGPIIGLNHDLNTWKWHIVIYIILSMDLSLFQNYLKVKDKNIQYAIVSIIQTLSLASLNILFLAVIDLGVSGYINSTLISYFIALFLSIILGNVGKDLLRGRVSIRLLKEMIVYSSPLIFNNISWWVVQSSDKLMIQQMISASALGIYTVSAKIPSLINVITSVFQQAWGISTIKEIESSNDSNFYSNVFNMLQSSVFFISICIIMITKPFMSIYVGKSFFDAWKYIPLLIIGAAFGTTSAFFGNMYGALKKSANSMWSTIFAAALNIFINLILIPRIGIWGAVVGTTVSYIAITVVRMIDCNRYLYLEISIGRFFINAAIATLLAVFVSVGVTPYIISVIALTIYLVFNRNSVSEVISKFIKIGSKWGE